MSNFMIVSNWLTGHEAEHTIRHGMMCPVKPGDHIALYNGEGYPAEVILRQEGGCLSVDFEDGANLRLANFYAEFNPSAPIRLSVSGSCDIDGTPDAFMPAEDGNHGVWACYSNGELDTSADFPVAFEARDLVDETGSFGPLEVVTSAGMFSIAEEPASTGRPKLVPILPDEESTLSYHPHHHPFPGDHDYAHAA